jgi:hypothetical protein
VKLLAANTLGTHPQAHHLILLVLFTAMGYLLSIKIFGNDYPTLQHGSPMIGAGLNLQRLFSIDTGTPDTS